MLSVIPDIDILIPVLEHRGPTHSVIMACIAFTPFFILYRKRAIPYFIALIQHSLLGDFIAGCQTQLLWPLSTQSFGTGINIISRTNITIEWLIFLTSIFIMLKTRERDVFFQPRDSNLILSVPTFTVLLPTFLSFPLNVPVWLIPPHLVYMFIFSVSIIISVLNLSKILKNKFNQNFRKLKDTTTALFQSCRSGSCLGK